MYRRPDKRYVKEIEPMSNGFSADVLDELCRVMKKVNAYFFCSQKQLIPLLDYFVKGLGCNWNIIEWHKTNPVPACGNKYVTDTEYVLFFREKGVRLHGDYKTKLTYYVMPLNVADKRRFGHPTVKPLEMVRNFVVNSSSEGDVVLDPYMGSGTTGAAAVALSRRFIGIEVEREYFDTACERIRQAGIPR